MIRNFGVIKEGIRKSNCYFLGKKVTWEVTIKMGTGFGRIREVCKKENAPFPEIEFNENYFYVTFRQSHEYLKLARGPLRETTQITTQKTNQTILETIKENPRITKRELASAIGISENGIKFHINSLKKKRMLRRVGPDKGGYWEILAK